MKPTFFRTLAAGTLVCLMSASTAFAGGSFSVTVQPGNQDEANMMRAGLGIYSVVNQFQRGGGIKQKGIKNVAGVLQNGFGNHAVVHQEGKGHNGTIQQHGNGHSYGLFQFGKGANAHVVQRGSGQTGTSFQFGW